jgi:SGNH domain-containing protein
VLGQANPGIVVLGSRDAREASVLIGRLLSSGKTVILIMPLLELGFDLPQRWVESQIRAGKAIDEWKVEAGPDLMMTKLRDEFAEILHQHRDNPRLIAVDPTSAICERDYCYLVRNGQANFRDAAHISNVNASQYGGLFDAAFKSALGAQAGKNTD